MTGNAMGQLEKFTKEILLHLAKMLHVDCSLAAIQRAQDAYCQQIAELVTRRVAGGFRREVQHRLRM